MATHFLFWFGFIYFVFIPFDLNAVCCKRFTVSQFVCCFVIQWLGIVFNRLFVSVNRKLSSSSSSYPILYTEIVFNANASINNAHRFCAMFVQVHKVFIIMVGVSPASTAAAVIRLVYLSNWHIYSWQIDTTIITALNWTRKHKNINA